MNRGAFPPAVRCPPAAIAHDDVAESGPAVVVITAASVATSQSPAAVVDPCQGADRGVQLRTMTTAGAGNDGGVRGDGGSSGAARSDAAAPPPPPPHPEPSASCAASLAPPPAAAPPAAANIGIFLRVRPTPRPSRRLAIDAADAAAEFNIPREAGAGCVCFCPPLRAQCLPHPPHTRARGTLQPLALHQPPAACLNESPSVAAAVFRQAAASRSQPFFTLRPRRQHPQPRQQHARALPLSV